jgi:predicted transcriptional regulator of viral defense system
MDASRRNTLLALGARAFTVAELCRLFKLTGPSLYVALSRWTREGSLRRLTPGLYALPGQPLDLEREALRLCAPAYLSFETVLARAGWLSTVPQTTTFATTRRTRSVRLEGRMFLFRQLRPGLFFGYGSAAGIPQASPEKALLDLAYLVDLGRERWPREDLDAGRADRKVLAALLRRCDAAARRRVQRALDRFGLRIA